MIHPVLGLPGGVSKADRRRSCETVPGARHGDAVEFGEFTLQVVPRRRARRTRSTWSSSRRTPTPTRRTTWAWWTRTNRVNFYDGTAPRRGPRRQGVRDVRRRGTTCDHVAEHVEPWSYIKFPLPEGRRLEGLRRTGPESGVYAVAPLARLNAADGMATPLAQEAYEEFYSDARRQAGAPHARHPLGPARRARCTRPSGWSSCRTTRRSPSPDVRTIPTQTPHGGHRRRRGAARHALPPLPDRRARAHHHGQPHRRDAEQRGPHRDVAWTRPRRADLHGSEVDRGPAEQGRDGVPRLRPVLRLRHALRCRARCRSSSRSGGWTMASSFGRSAATEPVRTLVLGLGNELAGVADAVERSNRWSSPDRPARREALPGAATPRVSRQP